MLKLKLQYFGHLMWRVDSLEKTLMLGGIGGRRRRGRQRMRWLDGITDSMDMSLSELREWWWTGRPGMLRFMRSQRVGHDWATELNWTELSSLSIPVLMLELRSESHISAFPSDALLDSFSECWWKGRHAAFSFLPEGSVAFLSQLKSPQECSSV